MAQLFDATQQLRVEHRITQADLTTAVEGVTTFLTEVVLRDLALEFCHVDGSLQSSLVETRFTIGALQRVYTRVVELKLGERLASRPAGVSRSQVLRDFADEYSSDPLLTLKDHPAPISDFEAGMGVVVPGNSGDPARLAYEDAASIVAKISIATNSPLVVESSTSGVFLTHPTALVTRLLGAYSSVAIRTDATSQFQRTYQRVISSIKRELQGTTLPSAAPL